MTPNDAYGQLVSVFVGWNGFLKDPQYVRNELEIAWNGARPQVLPEKLTRQDILELSRQGQFTFRVAEDDSLIQISYRFTNNGDLDAARLAFYELGEEALEEDVEVLPFGEPEDSSEQATWVRFDYCHTGRSRVLHMDSHLHVSGLPGIRFAVTGIPTPKQFVEFVASHFYPHVYRERRLTNEEFANFTTIDRINSVSASPQFALADLYKRIPHFRIPGD
jgi:hypothetical protein